METYLIGKETYKGKTFSGSTLLRDYIKHSEKGWKVIWSGEGKIAMINPKPTRVWRRK